MAEKKLYPFKFIPIPSKRVWGGNALINKLGKEFTVSDENGEEIRLTTADRIGESWELADMGFEDSVLSNGWLAGNTIGEIMETYLERVVGEKVYDYYGRQFPLLIKFLDIQDKLSVQVHPNDEVGEQRYDSLGKTEMWYVMDAEPGAKVYMGFKQEISAQELYDRCKNGTVDEVLNVIYPKKGDCIFIAPGTIHAADKGLLIAEIQESSDLTFRLYDWGREFNPATAREMHLEEAMDFINYGKYDEALYRKGPLWDESEGGHKHDDKVAETLSSCEHFTVNKITLADPLHIYTEKFGSYIIYICIEGEASIQVQGETPDGGKKMDSYSIKKGETILIPAEMPDFFLVPVDRNTVLLEAIDGNREDKDEYINPNTEPYLEGEDYEGLEDEEGCNCGHDHGDCDHDDCGCGHHHEGHAHGGHAHQN